MRARDQRATSRRNAAFEAMIPVLERKRPVIIETTNHVDIRNAVEFAKEENLNYVLAR